MSDVSWRDLLSAGRRARFTSTADWFDLLAERLLNSCMLHAGGVNYRLAEIEFYYRSPQHPDPFVHGHRLQKTPGAWYLHRHGSGFRGGSFKGIDLCFGNRLAYGGILLRSIAVVAGKAHPPGRGQIEMQNRELISGPSLVVDTLMRNLQAASVTELYGMISKSPAWTPENPLHISWQRRGPIPIWRTQRVGLKRLPSDVAERYRCARYRYLNEPRRITKGRGLLIAAMLDAGMTDDAIARAIGCTKAILVRRRRLQLAASFTRPFGRHSR
ncbi:MAG: hypothetical protein ACP5O1_00025 [Phycisphaerae bacterium]